MGGRHYVLAAIEAPRVDTAPAPPHESGVYRESDYAYYQRRADEEQQAAEAAACQQARASHLQLSMQYSILADMIRTHTGQRTVYDND